MNRTSTPLLGFAALAVMAVAAAGCSVASAPIQDTSQVVATPQKGQFTVSVSAHKAVGQVVPVQVSIANGTNDPRQVVPSQVFAINDAGERVAPIPPGEAARQAGDSAELWSAIKSGAVSTVAGGAIGAAVGAIAGAVVGSPGTGAALGSAIGGGTGAFEGAGRGQDKADKQADQQINALALKPADVNKDFTVSGYVFYPKGTYQRIDMLLIDPETGDTQTVSEPWH